MYIGMGGIERTNEAHGLYQKTFKPSSSTGYFLSHLFREKEAFRTENANKDLVEVRTIDSEFRSSNLPLPLR